MVLLTWVVLILIKLPKKFSIHWQHIIGASNFMLLGFAGQLYSKTDLISASFILDDKTVGQYQIIITLLFLLQSLANMIIVPFLKNYYRLNQESTKKINTIIRNIGVIISPIGVGIIALLLHYFYQISFSWLMFLSGVFFSLSAYISIMPIYELYKKNQSKKVLFINVLGIPILMICYFLLSVFGTPTLELFLLFSSINQLLLAYIYSKTNSISTYIK